MDGVHFRERYKRHRATCRLRVHFARPLLIEAAVARIGTDDKQVAARLQALVSDSRRKRHHVTCLYLKGTPFTPTELHDGLAGGNAQDLMGRCMEVQEGMYAVAPPVAPSVRGEDSLEPMRRIGRSAASAEAPIETTLR